MILSVFLLGLAPTAPAQEPKNIGPKEVLLEGCRRCDFTGVVACNKHPKELGAMEHEVEFCTVAAQCKTCQGALFTACAKCDGGPQTELMVARRASIAEWFGRPHDLENFLEKSLLRIETPHLRLAGDVKELREGKKGVSGHLFMHHVARDGELVAKKIAEHFQVKPKDYRSPMRLWFWNEAATHRKVMLHFLGSGSAGDFKWLGKHPRFSAHCGDNTFKFDASSLHSLGVHNVGHMLISNLFVEMWIGDMQGGWFDSGSAHWYEEFVFKRVQNHCIDEIVHALDYHKGIWRSALRDKMSKEDEAVAVLPSLLRKLTGTMMPVEHAQAWSFYDWLVHNHTDTLAPILKGLKRNIPERELFPKYLDMNLRQAEVAWRLWVQETYPKKEPRRKKGR